MKASMRRGFTLIELMVASFLLAMLVTALTMIFNQSSIAWRTGVASVAFLGDVRQKLGAYGQSFDELLPNVGGQELGWRTVSLWTEDGSLRQRTVESASNLGGLDSSSAKNGGELPVRANAGSGQKATSFIVGIRSAGPDGKFDTEDDITTWPEGMN